MPPPSNFFISYNRADQNWAEWVAWHLEDAGYSTAIQAWDFRPGMNFVERMQRATSEAERIIAVLSPDYLSAPYSFSEWASAFGADPTGEKGKLLPVRIRDCEPKGLLPQIIYIDLVGLSEEEAREKLLAGVRLERAKPEKAPAFPGSPKPSFPGGGEWTQSLLDRGYRCMAPAQEPFVQRSEYGKVRDALLGGVTVGITTAIHGAGGFGKTALAVELCYDPVVRERYPDGVLWVQMRDNLNDDGRLKEVRDVLRRWTNQEPPAFETVAKAGQHLVELLNGKRALLVVDDAWHSGDVSPFHGLDPTAALLITTRDSRTLPRKTVSIHVDSMEIPEAVQLLGAGLPDGAEAELKALAARLGEWPLLLKLVNRQVAEWVGRGFDAGEAIRRAENALKAKGLTYFEPKDAKDRSQAAALTLEVSLERLSQEEQERFTQLAIFPEDASVPFSVLEKLWQLDSFDIEELSSRLHALSLLRDLNDRAGTIRLHDVIRTYLLKRGESQLAEWHRRLLDAYRPANRRWPDLPREESYLWNHLVHHLSGAGQSELCRGLLLDFEYLRSKLEATGVNALLADYSSFVERDGELRLVRDALRLSAHVLARNPAELLGQLLGRLMDRQEPGIRGLLENEGPGTPWLRPRKATLTRPGGSLIRRIDHPDIPNALAVLPDGRVVSGSDDRRLRVWDVESGQILQTFEGHSDWVRAVAVLDSRRVISGSSDGTLRVWDVESGQTLQILQGHSDGVPAVAVLNSRQVVSGSSDGTLRVWELESGRTLQVLEGHSKGISAVAVLDSRRVVSGSYDQTLRVWDVETGQTLQIFKGHSSLVSAVAVLDSRRVVSGSYDQTLRVWDVESGQTLQTFQGHSDWVRAVAVLDSRRVVSDSDDQTLRVWDVESGQTLQILQGHSNWVSAVAVLDSRRVVSSSYDRTLRVWNVESSQTLQTFEGLSNGVGAVAELDDQGVVDLESGQTLRTLGVSAIAVLNGRQVVVSGSYDGTLRVLDTESRQTLRTLKGHSNWISAVAALDSRRVVSGSDDQTLRVWDVESGKVECMFTLDAPVIAVAVNSDRRIIGVDDRSGGVHFFDFVEPLP